MLETVNGLWIGQSLGWLGRLSITSFLQHGHEYHLYCYDDISDAPDGTVLKDAREVLPASEIFAYQHGPGRGSVSAFSNLFRYKLLLDKGGWWVDTDVVCLRPFNFSQPIIFASERVANETLATTCIIKLPVGHPVADQCYSISRQADRQTLKWGEIGPNLIHQVIQSHNLSDAVKDVDVFCPIYHFHWQRLIDADPTRAQQMITDKTYAVHLWHEYWRRNGIDQDNDLPSASYFMKLMQRFEVNVTTVP